jgi:hypothetical protein
LEESEEHDCFDVTGDGDGNLENCKDEVADEERGSTAIQFACGKEQVSIWRAEKGRGGKGKDTY